MNREAFDTLISAVKLRSHLHDPGWVVFDCRFSLGDTSLGERQYREAHIPGARYAHLDRDLSGTVGPGSGRHPLPAHEKFARWLGGQGVNRDTQVVVYDGAQCAIAARLWWMLRWLGHDRAALLEGGFSRWREQGFPVTAEAPALQAREFFATPLGRLWCSSGEVVTKLNETRILLVDARAEKRFRGEEEPIDRVAGHVPGAVNLPWEGNLDPHCDFLPRARLRERFLAVTGGREAGAVVHMCGSGVTACHNLLAMEIAGLTGSLLYPGSWSEWIADPARPVAKDEA
jgi:thiosulfate/3-mercaptopyruvate sulfurtransferase